MNKSGFALKNNPLKDRGIPSNPKNGDDHCMESTEIAFTRHVSKRNTFNAEYYGINILTELLPLRQQVNGMRLVILADNSRPHTARERRAFCEENRLLLALHPPYAPDLAPSDLFSLQTYQELSADNRFSLT
jgi:hypothetical protein